jgi:hypothetical protein
MRSFINCTLFEYNYNDQAKDNEMGRVCSMNGGEEKCIQNIDEKVRIKGEQY